MGRLLVGFSLIKTGVRDNRLIKQRAKRIHFDRK